MGEIQVVVSRERARGCGYRKPAKDGVGIYLVGPDGSAPCGRLPVPLEACPVCGGGTHAARGWQWVEPRKLFPPKERATGDLPPLPKMTSNCCYGVAESRKLLPFVGDGYTSHSAVLALCERCPLGAGMPEGRHGLIWIGGGHYESPADFMVESKKMGVSRKIKAVPKGFELGKTVVYFAHAKAIVDVEEANLKDLGPAGWKYKPGIFTAFVPTEIDLVVEDAANVPEKAKKLAEHHGARIVVVEKIVDADCPIVRSDESHAEEGE